MDASRKGNLDGDVPLPFQLENFAQPGMHDPGPAHIAVRRGRHVLASLARPSMSLPGVPAVASACRRPMRVCNRSAGYPLRSAAQNWWAAAADVVLTPPQVALPAVRNRVSGCSNYIVDQVELSGLEPLTSCMP